LDHGGLGFSTLLRSRNPARGAGEPCEAEARWTRKRRRNAPFRPCLVWSGGAQPVLGSVLGAHRM